MISGFESLRQTRARWLASTCWPCRSQGVFVSHCAIDAFRDCQALIRIIRCRRRARIRTLGRRVPADLMTSSPTVTICHRRPEVYLEAMRLFKRPHRISNRSM
ncbi:hypothetical protein PoB_003706400 [Plakobranchus ocellatus]|uniref:Uncharacterized protein n=1 Tax=Plakobranchus ocellatus TaxID=259542 RepID=A0AAV4AWP9_9GAST|nr:hypothetical protein PoB_003706400 [Plakobranchus ocellatus]